MKLKNSLLALISIFLIACENKIDSNIISNGTIVDDEIKNESQNLDKKSYSDIEDVLVDNKELNLNENTLIIFGKNGCQYCDLLKESIKNSNEVKNALKNKINTYYINISYNKNHNLISKNKNINVKTQDLASLFNVRATPSVIFINKDSNVSFIIPGFIREFSKQELFINLIDDLINGNKKQEYKTINDGLSALFA